MATLAVGNHVLRRVISMLGEANAGCIRPLVEVAGSDGGLLIAPSIVWADPDDCKKESKQSAKKLGPVCRAPDLRKKPIPPYVYGYCKEPEPELPMSCPPRSTKKRKGPCCLNEEQKSKKGGCRNA